MAAIPRDARIADVALFGTDQLGSSGEDHAAEQWLDLDGVEHDHRLDYLAGFGVDKAARTCPSHPPWIRCPDSR